LVGSCYSRCEVDHIRQSTGTQREGDQVIVTLIERHPAAWAFAYLRLIAGQSGLAVGSADGDEVQRSAAALLKAL
jgi:hypothetical protein